MSTFLSEIVRKLGSQVHIFSHACLACQLNVCQVIEVPHSRRWLYQFSKISRKQLKLNIEYDNYKSTKMATDWQITKQISCTL